MATGAEYAFPALGFALVYRTAKFFNLTAGSGAMTGGYIMFYLFRNLRLSLMVSMAGSVLFSAILGYALWEVLFSSLRKKKSLPLNMLLASLGILITTEAAIALAFSHDYQVIQVPGHYTIQIENLNISYLRITPLLFNALLVPLLFIALRRTRLGKSVRAVSDNEDLAAIAGIDPDATAKYAFVLGTALSALGGIFLALDAGVSPTVGLSIGLKSITATIIGGGTLLGTATASYFLGVLEHATGWIVRGEWSDIVTFMTLILFLFIKARQP